MAHLVKRVIGSRIHATACEDACEEIIAWAEEEISGYVIAANVHLVMTAFWRRSYQKIINNAALVTPNGKLLVLALRLLGMKQLQPANSLDLMLACCDRAQQEEVPIYLYGATPLILAKLERKLEEQYPDLMIAGSHAPPPRYISSKEAEMDITVINDSGAAIVFVSLTSPKQEQWMAKQIGQIHAMMIGVGTAFASYSEETSQAPWWLKKLGLEGLYDFATHPKQRWRKYLINLPTFIVLFTLQLIQYWSLSLLGLKRKKS